MSSMEVDQSSLKSIRLHPLAIIGISDHHTRISMGGSELPSTNPTIGLLFGHTSTMGSEESVMHIIDAEEVETSLDPSSLSESQLTHIRTKIELHQKVFPTHEVVGWYTARDDGISSSNSSSEEDGILPTTRDLNIHCGWMKEFVTGDGDPLFVLMDTSETSEENSPKSNVDNDKSEGDKARDKLDREQELPLSLYETTTSGGVAFVNMDFTVETYEPERIAVEKVLITQPKYQSQNATVFDSKPATNDDGDAKMSSTSTSSPSLSSSSPPSSQSQQYSQHAPSEAEVHLQASLSSIDGMNTRVAILLDFLHQTRAGNIPPHHHLLRQVMSLVRQLPLVKGGMGKGIGIGSLKEKEFDNEYDDMLVMTYLATLAKTASAVVGYADKFRVVEEGKQNVKMGSMGSTASGNISGSGGGVGSGSIHLDSSSLGAYVM